VTPKTLHLAPGLDLPLEVVTRRLAILAMSGAGKSNTAVVLAERMFDAGIPWVAIDPKGDWWGVRSSRDGMGPGLPVPIFGGLHGDIPLEPTAGRVIGDLIVDQRLTCVLDVSEFAERQQMWGFLIDLGDTLLRRNRQALHLFLEECDEYLPQRTSEKGNLPKCLGVWQRLVKRGRFRGIGSSQITQRNASLNKDTLYQAEALIAMRVTGKADRDAVRGWVEYHNAGADIVASLPTLQDGEGWVISPAWLRDSRRVTFDRRRTFDSGATPVLLKGNAPPATLADVDLEVLRSRMASTIEKAKADDPGALRRQIAELKKELAKKPAAALPAKTERVEVPILADAQVKRLEDAIAKVYAAADQLAQRQQVIVTEAGLLRAAIAAHRHIPAPSRPAPAPSPRPAAAPRSAPRPLEVGNNGHLTGTQQKILDVAGDLYERGITPTRDAIARWLDIHPNGGRYGSDLAALRAGGYLSGGTPTDAGRELCRERTRGLDGALEFLEGTQKRILDAIVKAANDQHGLTRDSLAESLGIHPNGGRFGSDLARLRTMGIITERGPIAPKEALFR
jgi:hypothetical protein